MTSASGFMPEADVFWTGLRRHEKTTPSEMSIISTMEKNQSQDGLSNILNQNWTPFWTTFCNLFAIRFETTKNPKSRNGGRSPADATQGPSKKRGEPGGTQEAPREHQGSTQEAPRRHPGHQGASDGICVINRHHSHTKCKKFPRLVILLCVFEGPSRIRWYLKRK